MFKYRLPNGNLIVADEAFIDALFPGAQRVEEAAPSLPRTLSVLAFRSRFSDGEKIAIYTAAETSAAIRVWLDDLAAAQNQTVDLDDSRIIGGVNAMEYGGMLAAGRAAEILA